LGTLPEYPLLALDVTPSRTHNPEQFRATLHRRVWDGEFESPSLHQRVSNKPFRRSASMESSGGESGNPDTRIQGDFPEPIHVRVRAEELRTPRAIRSKYAGSSPATPTRSMTPAGRVLQSCSLASRRYEVAVATALYHRFLERIVARVPVTPIQHPGRGRLCPARAWSMSCSRTMYGRSADGARVVEDAQCIGAAVKLDVDRTHLMLRRQSSASSSLSRRPTSIPIRSRKLFGVLRLWPSNDALTSQILAVKKKSAQLRPG
jgi:hypothetical protein